MEKINLDPRPIDTIYFEEFEGFTVGVNGVTLIEPYKEPGEMGMVIWFKIWRDEYLWQRIQGKSVAGVIYKESE